jgi:chemotaxis response regulator CheB
LSPVKKGPGTDVRERLVVDAVPTKNEAVKAAPSSQLIAIGASTGGTQALEKVISELRSDTPSIDRPNLTG